MLLDLISSIVIPYCNNHVNALGGITSVVAILIEESRGCGIFLE
jgi:hypothetical protein